MGVYVDEIVDWTELSRQRGLRHTHWAHLTADTREELLVFARGIGLRLEWRQSWDTPTYHFDVTPGKRSQAIRAGAVPVDFRGMAKIVSARIDAMGEMSGP